MGQANSNGSRPVDPPSDATWPVLAGIRFFLAMVVVAAHLQVVPSSSVVLKALVNFSGFVAVLCFFVISGYSIAHSLALQPKGFYRRRLLRIYPLYLVAVIVPVVLQWRFFSLRSYEISNATANLFFLQTFTTFPMPLNSSVWTLAVEMCCYLLAPWLARRNTITLLGLTGVSAAAFVLFPRFGIHYYAYVPYGGPLLVLGWAWLAGFIFYRRRFHAESAIVLAIGLLVLLHLNPRYTDPWYIVPVAVTVAGLGVSRFLFLGPTFKRLLSFAGDVSYPLYLLHAPTIGFLVAHDGFASPAALLGVTLAIATAAMWVDAILKRPVRVLMQKINQSLFRPRFNTAVAAGVLAAELQSPIGISHAPSLASPDATDPESIKMP